MYVCKLNKSDVCTKESKQDAMQMQLPPLLHPNYLESPPHKDIPTPLCLVVLVIQRTPRAPPGLASLPLPPLPHLDVYTRTLSRIARVAVLLAPSIVPRCHGNSSLNTLRAEGKTAVVTRHRSKTRL